MPSHSVKQAKTMSAIAHGWQPTGEAAGIPKKVAKEFHAADKGKKYGASRAKRDNAMGKAALGGASTESRNTKFLKKEDSVKHGGGGSYDRSGHFPGNPGFKREGKPPYGEYNAGAHAKQPRGKSIGNAPTFTGHRPNQSYDAELTEHHGKGGSGMGKHHGEVANNGPADRGGSELQEKGPAPGNHSQPQGKSLGAGRTDIAEHHVGQNFGGVAHSFRPPAANMAHGYGHAGGQRKGVLRMSGHSGAHRVGHRGK